MITYRPATLADSRALFSIFEAALDDLGARIPAAANSTAGDRYAVFSPSFLA